VRAWYSPTCRGDATGRPAGTDEDDGDVRLRATNSDGDGSVRAASLHRPVPGPAHDERRHTSVPSPQ